MPERKTIQGYLAAVEEQIRWKRARPVVAQELERHLEDQRDAFAAEGKSPEEAERLAVEEMGDPVAVGTELDRVHRPRPQWGMLAPVALSLCVWLGWQVLRHTRALASGKVLIDQDYVAHCVLSALLALAVLAAVYFADYTLLGRRPIWLAFGGTILLDAALLLPSIWAYTPLLMPVFFSLGVYALRDGGKRGTAACLILFLLQLPPGFYRFSPLFWPVIFCDAGILLTAAKLRWIDRKQAAKLLAVCLTALLVMTGLFFSGKDMEVMRAHMEMQWSALGQARLFGMAALSEGEISILQDIFFWDCKDFLRYVILRWGWAAFAVIQMPVLFALGWGWRQCRRQTAVLGRSLGTAALLVLTWQVLGYLAQTLTGLGDVITMYPYPFLTYGGTALVVDCALLGLLLSVFRSGSVVREDSRGRACIPRRDRFAIHWQNSQNDEKILTVSLILKRR